MSEHRRKPPQPSGGGRAAARRGATQPPSGRRAAPPRGAGSGSHSPMGDDDTREYGSRAEARRAARSGGGGGRAAGRRRAAGAGAGAGAAAANGRKRLVDYPRHDRYGWKRWVPSWKQVTGICLTGLLFLLGGSAVAYALVEEPNPNEAAVQQNNVYYWKGGSRMVAAGSDTNRQRVGLDKMPMHLQNAVIAAENDTFRTDRGISVKGMARAVVNMATGGETQGGSTITQQYVKNMFLTQDQTIKRKFQELFISLKLGDREDKDKVLEGYLNTSWFGRNANGIQAAAQAYYYKNAEDLNASESAFLAALLKGEGTLNPDYGPKQEKAARERWAWILDRQVEVGLMDASERAKYTADKFPMPKPQKPATGLDGQKGYMVNLANSFVKSELGITDKQLGMGGYQIYTTFEKEKVDALDKVVKRVLKKNLDPKNRPEDQHIQVGGASVVPGDGAIAAIYGGENYFKHFTNNADYTGVQVGSTYKPFVLAAALDKGVLDPNGPGPDEQPDDMRTPVSLKSIYNGDNKIKLYEYDHKTYWQNEDGEQWLQPNDGNQSYGPVDLREAMRLSINTPFIQLGMDVGLKEVKNAAVAAGLRDDKSMASLTPTFSLGTSAPSAIRLANAYGTFAKSGEKVEPYSVLKVEYNGEVKYKHETKKERAFPADVADTVTDALRTVVEEGTGSVAKEANLGRPAAGKTGTTDDNKSAWFAGYTPQLSTTVGMWRVDSTAKTQEFLSMNGVAGLDSIHGASFPAEIWTEYMKIALKGKPVMQFPVPQPIGDVVYGPGQSPEPEPEPSETESESPTPEPSASPTKKPGKDPKPSPSTGETCGIFGCVDSGGTTTGGTTDGGTTDGTTTGGTTTDGGTTDGTTTDGSTTTGGNGNGNGNGGLFSGGGG
ncbi:transglycosylase domain-containing protein [Streptomyces thermolineatus]